MVPGYVINTNPIKWVTEAFGFLIHRNIIRMYKLRRILNLTCSSWALVIVAVGLFTFAADYWNHSNHDDYNQYFLIYFLSIFISLS